MPEILKSIEFWLWIYYILLGAAVCGFAYQRHRYGIAAFWQGVVWPLYLMFLAGEWIFKKLGQESKYSKYRD